MESAISSDPTLQGRLRDFRFQLLKARQAEYETMSRASDRPAIAVRKSNPDIPPPAVFLAAEEGRYVHHSFEIGTLRSIMF